MDTNKFVNRHVGISAEDIPAMLETIGVKSLDELIDQTIPANIRLKEPLNLPEAMTERRAYRRAGFQERGIHLLYRYGLVRHGLPGPDPT